MCEADAMNFTEGDFLLFRDAYSFLLGEVLGSGLSRKVFTIPLLPGFVGKVESRSCGYRQNFIEWYTWQRVKDTDFARWFAPCKDISPDGCILIMERTVQPHSFPKRMPAFLTDFKHTNYGVLRGRLVCHDYGTNNMLEHGMTKKMRRVDWVTGE
jgi:hypothetical protein